MKRFFDTETFNKVIDKYEWRYDGTPLDEKNQKVILDILKRLNSQELAMLDKIKELEERIECLSQNQVEYKCKKCGDTIHKENFDKGNRYCYECWLED